MGDPDGKDVAEQHQTEHKLEAMSRYFVGWMKILAQTTGRHPFCSSHLYVIDTHTAAGAHKSDNEPDGFVPGTTVLAAHRAREVQRQHPTATIHVRGFDVKPAKTRQLAARLEPLRGAAPERVDVVVTTMDWRRAVPGVVAELQQADHPHGGNGRGRHDHRSLWFLDPYGVDTIDHALLESLPPGSEVIINLDVNAFRRHLGKALGGDEHYVTLLDTVWGGRGWEPLSGATPQTVADAFAGSFGRWTRHAAHLLRATGVQDRALVQLADSPAALRPFQRAVEDSRRVNTILAGDMLSSTQRGLAAGQLLTRFAGMTISIAEMQLIEPRWTRGQLRAICSYADHDGYGAFDASRSEMTWVTERKPPVGLFG